VSDRCRVCGEPATQVVGNHPYCERHRDRATRRLGSLWRVDLLSIGVLVGLVVVVYVLDALLKPRLEGIALAVAGLLLAIVPAAIWLSFFYRRDRREPEPRTMVLGVAVLGALVGSAIVIPLLRDVLAVDTRLDSSPLAFLAGSILIVGVVEEFAKYLTIRFSVYQSDEFDERADGVVYASAAGVGLAVALNVAFVVESGGVDLGAAAIRVVVTALAQGSFAAIVGYFLARQKLERRPVWWMPLGLAIAATLNGVFTFLRGTVTRGDFDTRGFQPGPWIGLALAAALAFGVTVALTALIRREFAAPVASAESGPA
jgi:RsiW-degrading membrane proteinase PrsW (M82 family)